MRRVGLSILLLGLLSVCSIVSVDLGVTCAEPDLDHIGPDGKSDPCHDEDGLTHAESSIVEAASTDPDAGDVDTDGSADVESDA